MALAAKAPSPPVAGSELQKIEALLGGSRVLSRRLTSVLDAHELLLHGLPASALDHLVGNLVIIGKNESLEKAVGMSLRTWQRRKDTPSKPLSQEQSGRAWKFAEILAKATYSAHRLRPSNGWNVPPSGLISVARSIFSALRLASS